MDPPRHQLLTFAAFPVQNHYHCSHQQQHDCHFTILVRRAYPPQQQLEFELNTPFFLYRGYFICTACRSSASEMAEVVGGSGSDKAENWEHQCFTLYHRHFRLIAHIMFLIPLWQSGGGNKGKLQRRCKQLCKEQDRLLTWRNWFCSTSCSRGVYCIH